MNKELDNNYNIWEAVISLEGTDWRNYDKILEIAFLLRDYTDDRYIELSLWSLLRKYSSCVPEEQAHNLLQFLRERDKLSVHQAALQGIQSIFYNSYPKKFNTDLYCFLINYVAKFLIHKKKERKLDASSSFICQCNFGCLGIG